MEFSFMPVAIVIGGVILAAIALILVVELLSSGILTRWRQ